MSLTRDGGHIVFQCDGKSCHATIETHTSNHDEAIEIRRKANWQATKEKPSAPWLHFCPECQGRLL